jgi:hypothetical protein
MKFFRAGKRKSIRTVLFAVVFVLGGWGVVFSLFDLADRVDIYIQNQNLSKWADTSDSLIASVQHLAFERGRSAVLLRGVDPVSSENRAFIDNRRTLADAALEKSISAMKKIPGDGYGDLMERWEKVRGLRGEVDRNLSLPRAQRKSGLVVIWYQTSTELIKAIHYSMDILISCYIPGDTRRLASFASTVLELRITAGSDATAVSQAASAEEAPSAEIMARIYGMRGIEDRLWYEIEINEGYFNIPELKKRIKEVKSHYLTVLRPMQDQVLSDLFARRKLSITVDELIAQSPPSLDGMSALAARVAEEARRTADKGKNRAILNLCWSGVWFISLIFIIGFSLRYVIRHIVRPLETINSELHRIGAFPPGEIPENEIDSLAASTVALERTLAARTEAEAAREKTIIDLQAAIEQVRTLSGFLPICANCKKIRDDQGYWGQVEEYISKHTDVQFSHGICPDCAAKLYGDIGKKKPAE